MYIQFSNSGIPSWATKHTPTQLYYRNSQGELTAFNGSEIEHNEYIDTLVSGIEDTLSNERSVLRDDLLRSKDEVLSKIPQYVQINKMYEEVYKLKLKRDKSFWTNSINNKIAELEQKAQLLVLEVKPNHYLSTHDSVYESKEALKYMVEQDLLSSLKSTPHRSQIKSLLVTVPDIKSKTFDELLSLTRTTFA